MPQCCSNQHCVAPQLPIAGVMMHKCTTCKKIVHNLCARIDEDGSGFGNGVLRYCRVCDGTTAITVGKEPSTPADHSDKKRKAAPGSDTSSAAPNKTAPKTVRKAAHTTAARMTGTPKEAPSKEAPVEANITDPFPAVKHLVYKPTTKKSIWLRFFHIFKENHQTNIDNKMDGRASCNLCGVDFKLSDNERFPIL